MLRKKESTAQENLPWLANGSLKGAERARLESWLKESPRRKAELTAWQKVGEALQARPAAAPSAGAWRKISARMAEKAPQPAGWFSWALSAALTVATLALLWLAVRPGVALRWTVTGETPTAFRIYRAEAGSSNYYWIDEVQADPFRREFVYSDTFLFPGKAYSYKIEAVGRGGVIAVSRSVAASPLSALPGQLAVLLTSLLVGNALALLLTAGPGTRIERRRSPA